jgi:cysteinyl-tRNA synthetase
MFNTLVRTPGAVTPKKVAVAKAFLQWTSWLGGLMSLFGEPPGAFLRFLDDMLLKRKNIARADVDKLVAARGEARATKDFAKADELRKQLVEMGIAVQDTVTGSEWEVAK